jgi:hypothetical protein
MKKREKILAAVAGSVVGVLLASLAFYNFVIVPGRDYQDKADKLRADIHKAEDEKNKEPSYRARFKEIAGETLGTDENKVKEQLRARIAEDLIASGMSAANMSLKSTTGRLAGVYKEVGWQVRARGKDTEVVKFLFLMSREAHIHRVDSLSLTPVASSNELEVSVKYATLMLDTPPGEKAPDTGKVIDKPAIKVLDDKEQLALYDGIVKRALFRPYIQAVPQIARVTPPPDPNPRQPNPRPPVDPVIPPTKAPPPPRYRLSALPAADTSPEVWVSDTTSGKTISYKPGDMLAAAGGRIVTVDYRPLPKSKDPWAPDSPSRVVLLVNNEYYSVECGAYLTQMRKMTDDQLPPGVPKLPPPPPKVVAPAKGVPATKVGAVTKTGAEVAASAPKTDAKEPTVAEAKASPTAAAAVRSDLPVAGAPDAGAGSPFEVKADNTQKADPKEPVAAPKASATAAAPVLSAPVLPSPDPAGRPGMFGPPPPRFEPTADRTAKAPVVEVKAPAVVDPSESEIMFGDEE